MTSKKNTNNKNEATISKKRGRPSNSISDEAIAKAEEIGQILAPGYGISGNQAVEGAVNSFYTMLLNMQKSINNQQGNVTQNVK